MSRGTALCLALLLAPPVAMGLSGDRDQPIHIEADRATLTEKGEDSIYEGNVHLRQGTLNLRGDRMTVHLADGRLDHIVLTGSPATYSQREDDKDMDQHAEAGRIEYHAAEEHIILLENARIWQDDAKEFRSERIVFDLKNNTVVAGGDSPQDRVHITLPPQDKPQEEAP